MRTLRDAIYGFVVADALGVPFEFKKRGSFKATDMIGHGTHNQPAGTWSDDTSMTLATCESIKRLGYIDYTDIMENFLKWYINGEFTANNELFDIGITTSQSLQNYMHGKEPLECGDADFYANGNGSLMRILPLAFMDCYSSNIKYVSKLTHAHHYSMTACYIYVDIARALIDGLPLRAALSEQEYAEPFDRLAHIDLLPEKEIKSSGYVVDTLEAALWCLTQTDNYKDCVLKAVNLGEDTDTVAAVAGGLAGIIYGYEGIPKDWIETLRNKELVENCLF